MIEPDCPADPALRRYLGRLPLAVPPAALEQRIVGRWRRRRDRRRLMLAAAALLVIGLLPRWLAPGSPLDPTGLDHAPDDPVQLRAEVRALDRQLQTAYASGIDRQQLDGLWLARETAARRLVDPSSPPAQQPVRL
jgi:hypothetical protein